MALTALGLGTKQAPDNVNLDPQSQFWSWLYAFQEPRASNSVNWAGGYIKGFPITQTDPAGMSVQIGVPASGGADCAVFEYAQRKMTVLSTDGTPQVVTIPTAPTSGSRIDSIVSYIDTTSADPETETPGTPEYVKTVVVSGTASSSPTAPNKQQIQAALPPTVENWYHWADVKVAANQTTITNSNITDRKPARPNIYPSIPATVPNWAGATTISSNSYTPSAHGYIQATYRIDTTQYGSSCTMTIAGKTALNAINNRNAQNYNYTDSIVVPVRKGVAVTFTTSKGGAFTSRLFVPLTTA